MTRQRRPRPKWIIAKNRFGLWTHIRECDLDRTVTAEKSPATRSVLAMKAKEETVFMACLIEHARGGSLTSVWSGLRMLLLAWMQRRDRTDALRRYVDTIDGIVANEVLRCERIRSAPTVVHQTAVVLCPPKSAWGPIQSIRKVLDNKHVDIWPPHVTLFYPFWPAEHFDEAFGRLKKACGNVAPFHLNADTFGSVYQGKKRGHVTFLVPSPPDPICALRNSLLGEFPDLPTDFHAPHMTVARGQPESQAGDLQSTWKGLTFNVDCVTVLMRAGNKAPMRIVETIPLGAAAPTEEAAGNTSKIYSHERPKLAALEALGFSSGEAIAALRENGLSEVEALRALASARGFSPPQEPPAPGGSFQAKKLRRAEEEALKKVFKEDFEAARECWCLTITPDVTMEAWISSTSVYPLEPPMLFLRGSVLSLNEKLELHAEVMAVAWTLKGQPMMAELRSLLIKKVKFRLAQQKADAAKSKHEEAMTLDMLIRYTATTELMTSSEREALEEALKEDELSDSSEDTPESVLSYEATATSSPQRHAPTPMASGSIAPVKELSFVPVRPDFSDPLEWMPSTEFAPLSVKAIQGLAEDALRKKLINAALISGSMTGHRARYKVVSTQNIVAPRLLRAFADQLEAYSRRDDLHGHLLPCAAFHGTSQRANIASIAQSGFLAAGQQTRDGTVVGQSSGAMYGAGVYTSPKFWKADEFAYEDSKGYRQVFLSLVCMGKAKHLKSTCEGQARPEGNYDSHISPDGAEYVTFSQGQVLPVLLVTYVDEAVSTPKPAAPASALPKKETDGVIDFFQVPGGKDLWMLSLPGNPALARTRPSVRLVFLLDTSNAVGSEFQNVMLPACAELHRTLQPDAVSAVLFGENVTAFKASDIASPEFFSSTKIKNTAFTATSDLSAGVAKALDIAISDKRSADTAYVQQLLKDLESGALDDDASSHGSLSWDGEEEDDTVDVKALKEKYGASKNLFVFVLMTPGAARSSALDDVLNKYQPLLAASEVDSVFKVIGVGAGADLSGGLAVKDAAQTVSVFENASSLVVSSADMVPSVVNDVAHDVNLVVGDAEITNLKIPEDEATFGCGLLPSFTSQPVEEFAVRMRRRGETAVMYKGSPPSVLHVKDSILRVTRADDALRALGTQASLLQLLASCVNDVKVAGETQDTTAIVASLKNIVTAIKEQSSSAASVRGMDTVERNELQKSKRRLVMELEGLVAQLSFSAKAEALADGLQGSWVKPLEDFRFGSKVLERARPVDHRDAVRKLLAVCESVLPQQSSDYVSAQSGMTSTELLLEVQSNPPSEEQTIVDMLAAYGVVGLQMEVHRSASSAIQPWDIAVKHVSSDFSDTASAIRALDGGGLKDSQGRDAPDVLPLCDPRNPVPFHKFARTGLVTAYMGAVFARNPALSVSGQENALLMVALCRVSQQLLDPEERTEGLIRAALHIVYTLRQKIDTEKGYYVDMLRKLRQDHPGKYMTEAEDDDVSSVAKILGALLACREVSSKGGLFSGRPTRESAEVAMAIVAECVARESRMMLKAAVRPGKETDTTKIGHAALLQLFGIREESVADPTPDGEMDSYDIVHSTDYDAQKAASAVDRFFKRARTNCPAAAAVGCITLLQHTLDDSVDDELRKDDWGLVRRIREGFDGVTVESFLCDYARAGAPEGSSSGSFTEVELKIAMVAQGIIYHTSKTRKNGLPSMCDPMAVLHEAVTHTRNNVYLEKIKLKTARAAAQRAAFKNKSKMEVGLLQQEQFMKTHRGAPKVFTAKEVARLNMSRPANDKFERMEGGMLRHRCCFPACPMYLKQLRSSQDEYLGQRYALFYHLRWFQWPRNFVLAGCHVLAERLMKSNPSKEQFVAKMTKGLTIHEIEPGFLEAVWDTYPRGGE